MNNNKEVLIACESIKSFDKPVLVGLHFNDSSYLPSKDSITEVVKGLEKYNCCGIIAACTSPETVKLILPEFKKTNLPYGFKVNAFKKIPDDFIINSPINPSEILGSRKNEDFNPNMFKTFVENCINEGANLLGGCCEITPQHIKSITNII